MSAPITLRTDSGDEHVDLQEFETRIRRGEVSPQCLVRFPPLTGEHFVQACELELFRKLHEPKRALFERTFSISKFPWITSTVIVTNVIVFVLTARDGQLQLDDMVRAGAKVGALVFDLGQLWRLFTANFLHHDALHVGLNMFVLFNVGGALENTYRPLDYVWLLIFAGLATMGTSLMLNDAVTVGSSGVVFGCLGGVVAFGLKYRSLLPSRYRSILGDAAIPTVLGFLMIGMTSKGVDNWAHIGGLMAGLLTGAFMRPKQLTDAQRWWWEPALRATPSLSILVLVFMGQTLFRDTLPNYRQERDDAFGLSVPVPNSWIRGANSFGTIAWYNGLSSFGRASFSAEAVEMSEGGDAMLQAKRFTSEKLTPQALGRDVFDVKAEAPEAAKVGDLTGLVVRAKVRDVAGRSKLAAFFAARGTMVYQLVFVWPAELPAYARVVDHMMNTVRFDESKSLRLARASALIFPNSSPQLSKLGTALVEAGSPELGAEALSVASRAEPSNIGLKAALARAWLLSGEVERACEAARAAMAFDDQSAVALEADARCELARGNMEQALGRLQQARANAPYDERLKAAEAKLKATVNSRTPTEP